MLEVSYIEATGLSIMAIRILATGLYGQADELCSSLASRRVTRSQPERLSFAIGTRSQISKPSMRCAAVEAPPKDLMASLIRAAFSR